MINIDNIIATFANAGVVIPQFAAAVEIIEGNSLDHLKTGYGVDQDGTAVLVIKVAHPRMTGKLGHFVYVVFRGDEASQVIGERWLSLGTRTEAGADNDIGEWIVGEVASTVVFF